MFDLNAFASELYTTLDAGFQEWIHAQIYNNEFLIAGIATVVLGGAVWFLRNVPQRIYNAFTERVSFKITINNDNELFVRVNEEVSKNSVNFLTRKRVVNGRKLTVGYGNSVSFFGGRLCFVERRVVESQTKESKETTELVFPFITKSKVEEIFAAFFKTTEEAEDNVTKIYQIDNGYLERNSEFTKRKRNSIFVNDNMLSDLENSLSSFLKNRDWYDDRGIPYKFGVLLEGPPGTGKTSLVKYLANYTNRELIIATPNNLHKLSSSISSQRGREWDDVTDTWLERKEKYIVLLEDIDCFDVVNERGDDEHPVEQKSSSSLQITNLSTILNVLDGMYSPENVIIIATTNHVAKLDSALLRKGRFDRLIHVGLLEDAEIKRMIESFCGTQNFQDKTFAPISGADLQNLILSKEQSAEAIIPELNIT